MGVRAAITVGARGQFTVLADGKPVAEKGELGFPDEGGVVRALQKLGG